MKGKLYILSGPSGVGKNTILNRILEQRENVRYSISATSRAMRPGEVDGKSYYFVTRERFEEMIRREELLEFAEYVGNYYGTPLAPIRQALDEGIDVVMDVEVVGGQKIKARMPEAVLVFVTVSSPEIIRQRLIRRGDVSEQAMEKRLTTAKWECEQAAKAYDYVIVNDDLETAVGEFNAVMTAEKCKKTERIRLLKEE